MNHGRSVIRVVDDNSPDVAAGPSPASPTSLRSCAQTLSPETLAKVFGLCLSTSYTRRHSHTHLSSDVTKAPWIFGHICSRWRKIALTSPGLWTNVRIDIGKLAMNADGRAEVLLQKYLDRSDNRLLSVDLTFDDETPEAATAALTILLASSSRWRYLSILLPRNALHFLHSITHSLPQLKRFNLAMLADFEDSENEVTAKEFGSFLLTAPQLQNALFGDGFNDYLPLFVGMPVLPWSQLLKFEIYGNTDPFNSARYVLEACPQLQHIRLSGGSAFEVTGKPVIHTKLLTMTVTCNTFHLTTSDLFDLLNLLTLPSLEVLAFESNWFATDLNFDDTDHPSALESLIIRSSCPRLRLRIDSTPVSREVSFITFLEETPSLQSLEFLPSVPSTMPLEHVISLSDDFVKRMRFVPGGNQRCLVPNLTTLVLEDSHNFNDDDAFASMVESRWRMPVEQGGQANGCTIARLREVSLVLDGEMGAPALSRLKGMRDERLNVRVWKRMDLEDSGKDRRYADPLPGVQIDYPPVVKLVPVLPLN